MVLNHCQALSRINMSLFFFLLGRRSFDRAD